MHTIRIAIVGVGNCASALVQGLQYYRDKEAEDQVGLMHWDLGGYTPKDIGVVAAFDIDQRKVGQDIHQAIFAPPNCTARFCSDTGRLLAMKGVYPMTEIECLEDKGIIEEVIALKVPGLDAERHLVSMMANIPRAH